MSTRLNLVDRLLAMGRNFQRVGRARDAHQILNRLAALRDLPSAVNEETQARLAEICLGEARYTKARRHLAALLVQCPDSARYHYLMATALDNDERADPHRAAEYYTKSLKLDPQQPRCLGELGSLQLRLGQTEAGLANLRRAVAVAPHDPDATSRLAEGLRQLGMDGEARSALRAALFRNPRDPRFRRLWNDFQFRLLHEEQQLHQAAAPATANSADFILPFRRPSAGDHVNNQRTIRRDPPSLPQPPHAPRIAGKKHA
jgi:tetratricopeptide (TPR) repeat protein